MTQPSQSSRAQTLFCYCRSGASTTILVTLLSAAWMTPLAAQEGVAIRVTADRAPVKVGNRVIGYAPKGAVVWATKFSGDNHWAWVKVPGAAQHGWMYSGSAQNFSVPEQDKAEWEEATQYFSKWSALVQEQKFEEAAKLAENAAETLIALGTEGYAPAATTVNAAGLAWMRLGKRDAAFDQFSRAHQLARNTLGKDHHLTALFLANAADMQTQLGRHAQAVQQFEEAFPVLKAKRDKGIRLETYLGRYGASLSHVGRHSDSQSAYRQGLSEAIKNYGDDAPIVRQLEQALATSLSAAGRYADAIPLAKSWLTYLRDQANANLPTIVNELNRFATLHARAEDFTTAEATSREALQLLETAEEPHAGLRSAALNNLGLALTKLEKFEEAAECLEEAMNLMEENESLDLRFRSFPVKNRAILALAQDNLPQARELAERVLEMRSEVNPPQPTSIAEAKVLLAQVADAEREDEDSTGAEAYELLWDALRIQEKELGIDHRLTTKTISLLRSREIDAYARDELELFVAEARERARQPFTPADQPQNRATTGQEILLAEVLRSAVGAKPETDYTPLRVTSSTADVRVENQTIARLPQGTVAYAFRVEGPYALIHIPGQMASGWIHQNDVQEVVFPDQTRQQLVQAEKDLEVAAQLHEQGRFTESISKTRQALSVLVSLTGPTSPYVGIARYSLGVSLAANGEIQTAAVESESGYQILVNALGSNHAQTATAEVNLADALTMAARYNEAMKHGTSALKKLHLLGNHEGEVFAAERCGTIAASLSLYEVAREYLEHSLNLSRTKLGDGHPKTAASYATLAELHVSLGEVNSAEEAYRRAFEISKSTQGAQHSRTLEYMLGYGQVLCGNSKVASGRSLIDQATDYLRAQGKSQEARLINADTIRAKLMAGLGEYSEAIAISQSAVARAAKLVGEEHPLLAELRKQLGEAYFHQEKYGEAQREFEEIFEIQRKTFGKLHHTTAYSLNAIGVCMAASGRLDEAKEYYQRALDVADEVLGESHADTLAYLYNAGEVHMMSGDYASARPRLEAAIEAAERHAGFTSDQVSLARATLGRLHVLQNDLPGAIAELDRAAQGAFEVITQVLPALSEREQLTYLAETFDDVVHTALGLGYEDAENSTVAARTGEWLLNFKGTSSELLGAQANVRQVASMDTRQQKKYERLVAVREQLARISLRSVPPDARPTHKLMLDRLSAEEQTLARELGQLSATSNKRSWASMANLRGHLPTKSILVNFMRVKMPNYGYKRHAEQWLPERYLAWVIPASGKGQVRLVDVGLATEIDNLVKETVAAICSPEALSQVAENGEQEASERAHEHLKRLAEGLLAPWLAHCREAEELILSPDSQLWTIPWAALPLDENELAVERFRLRYVTSGREILADAGKATPARAPKATAPLIVADPAFDRRVTSNSRNASSNLPNQLRSTELRFADFFKTAQRLPGTAAEANAIRNAVGSFSGVEAEVLVQGAAQEGAVKAAANPHCLVLSTHGFFFPTEEENAPGSGRLGSGAVARNPLLRCGLLFSGCHHADAASSGANDGLLTGMEILNCQLRGTELVVLSACETGLGDVRDGQGVAGLRHAFQLAGAKSVVASLWQVDDGSTARLMNDFFANLAAGATRAEALRQAQLKRIRSRRERNGGAHPFFWAAFTLTGES